MMKELFKSHIELRIQQTKALMEDLEIDNLFIESGFPDFYFLDDQPTFFKTNPHFAFYCPDPGQGHVLKISLNASKPELFYHIPNDFWHEVSSLRGDFWEDFFNITVVNDYKAGWSASADSGKKNILISPNTSTGETFSCTPAGSKVFSHMHWLRSQKTEYEIECIRRANQSAALGHIRAKELFHSGATENEIFMQYLIASGQKESELPYNSIVALDKNSAILHYQFPKKVGSGQTFLIDAGYRYNGYCSDITRTYAKDSVDSVFKDILQRVEDNQKKLCQMVMPGLDYVEIHRESYRMVAKILVDFNLFKGSLDEAMDKKVPFQFYPHGIGHPLGLQVHDVAAKQSDADGSLMKQPDDFPYLRTLRPIQENDVLTIEPGFYMIPLLLNALKKQEGVSKSINWDLLETLIPYGGIRIEDDLVTRKSGPENLTRPFLP